MLVLGLMSGTSADGIDAALVRITGAPPRLRARLKGFHSHPYPPQVREAILRIANVAATTTGEISQLNFLLGEFFARAAMAACRKLRVPLRQVSLIGSHGQTVFHQGSPGEFLGHARVASTLQIGEPAVIAERTGIPVIADFRPADMAAGGQGAPLVPFVDFLLYRHGRFGRIALNVGGIANLTVLPAKARPSELFAFDTGPGNMVIDALARHFTGGRESCDRDARWARRGVLLPDLLARLLRDSYFARPAPKSCGREQYGDEYVRTILEWSSRNRARPEDLLHTATVLTAVSIVDAIRRFVLPRASVQQLIVAGGGARNPLLMAQLDAGLRGAAGNGQRIELVPASGLGVPENAKEAFAFAVLAYESFHRRPANLPSATGARHPATLGKLARPFSRKRAG